MDRRWKGSADKGLQEVLKFFRWLPAINLLPTSVNQDLQRVKLGFLLSGFPGGTSDKEPVYQWGDKRDVDSVSGSGGSPGGGHSNPLQYSCLENPMDRGAWQAVVHRVIKSWTQLKWLHTHTYTHTHIHSHTHTHTQSHIALLTGTKKKLRFMFQLLFFLLPYLFLHTLGLTKVPPAPLLPRIHWIIYPKSYLPLQMLWTCWLDGTQLLWSPWWLIPIPMLAASLFLNQWFLSSQMKEWI